MNTITTIRVEIYVDGHLHHAHAYPNRQAAVNNARLRNRYYALAGQAKRALVVWS
jgi:hypothetical protein